MQRYCPACTKKLTSFDNYFCSSCGAELPSDIVLPDKSHLAVKKFKRLPKPHMLVGESVRHASFEFFHLFNVRGLALAVSGMVFLVGCFLLGRRALYATGILTDMRFDTGQQAVQEAAPQLTDAFAQNYMKTTANMKTGYFSSEGILSYIPDTVDAYIEGHDLGYLWARMAAIRPGLEDVAVTELLKDHYGLLVKYYPEHEQYEVLLLGYLRESDSFQSALTDQVAISEVTIEIYDDLALISTTPELITAVKDTKRGFAKSITHSAKFSEAKHLSVARGKMAVFFLTDMGKDFILREDLSGFLPDFTVFQEKVVSDKFTFIVLE